MNWYTDAVEWVLDNGHAIVIGFVLAVLVGLFLFAAARDNGPSCEELGGKLVRTGQIMIPQTQKVGNTSVTTYIWVPQFDCVGARVEAEE